MGEKERVSLTRRFFRDSRHVHVAVAGRHVDRAIIFLNGVANVAKVRLHLDFIARKWRVSSW